MPGTEQEHHLAHWKELSQRQIGSMTNVGWLQKSKTKYLLLIERICTRKKKIEENLQRASERCKEKEKLSSCFETVWEISSFKATQISCMQCRYTLAKSQSLFLIREASHTKAVGKEDAQTYSPANIHPRKKLCLDSRKTPTLSLLVITFWHNQKGFWRIQTLHEATRQISFHQHFTLLQLETTVKFLCTKSQFIFKCLLKITVLIKVPQSKTRLH